MTTRACLDATTPSPPTGAWRWPALSLVQRTLPNGLRVILAERHSAPLVFLSWTSPGGFDCDPDGLDGLASLTPLLLRDGTAHRSGVQITRALDGLGATLATGVGWDSASINLGLLSRDLDAGLELLLDLACAPRVEAEAVTRRRQRQLAQIARRSGDAHAIADDAFARAVFGRSVYGRSPLGTTATLRHVDAAAVEAFHRAHYRQTASTLVIAGSVDSDAFADRLTSLELPPAIGPAPPPLRAPMAVPASPAGVRIVDVPHATHAEIRVGHLGVARDHEDLPVLDVLNAILGGGPSSRLARGLRGHEGLTYRVRSRFTARRLGGMFVVETSVAADRAAAALAAIRREIDALRETLVPAADVERAKRALFGEDLRRFQDLIGTGSTLGPIALRGDPERDIEQRANRIAAVEPDDVRDTAQRHLHAERLICVVAGPGGQLRSVFPDGVDSRESAVRCES